MSGVRPGRIAPGDGDGGGRRVLVADLGATHLRIAVVGGGSVRPVALLRTADLDLDPVRGIAPAVVRALLDSWRRVAPDDGRGPDAVGVGVAAYVSRDGSILQARPFGLLPGPEIRDRLAAAFDCPVAVDNDANLAALGELHFGAGLGCEDFLLVTLGTNVGLGIVCDGRIVRGAHGAAGEAGNLLVSARRGRDGRAPLAKAGRLGAGLTDGPAGYAWLEDLAGGGALNRSLDLAGPSGPRDDGRRASFSAGDGAGDAPGRAPRGVLVRAAAGDRRAVAVVGRAIESWSLLFANLVALFDPARIVLSGGLVEDLRPFMEPLRRRAAELSPLPPDIRIGELGAQAGLVGAAVAADSAASARIVATVGAGPDGERPQSRPDQRPIVTGR